MGMMRGNLSEITIPDRHVTVMGLGYVGLTLAVVMAEIGFTVDGIEIRPQVVEDLKRGQPHFSEPGLTGRLAAVLATGRLRISERIPAGTTATVYIVTVGTPLGADGHARLDMIESVTAEIGQHLQANDLIILRSTVKLGTTEGLVRQTLERTGKPFDLAFCPERTIEGNALMELQMLPQIVGGITSKAALRASQIFQHMTPTVVRVSSPMTAEMIKLVDNAQRDLHFAYANEVAHICDAIGVSGTEVIQAGKLGYPRTNLAWPGPVGGPCLEKDPYILAESGAAMGFTAALTLTARKFNQALLNNTADFIAEYIAERQNGKAGGSVVALLGIAFKGKPATDDLRGTTARPILDRLRERLPGATFRSYDPVVSLDAQAAFGLQPCPSLADAFLGADLAVILNNHPVFTHMPLAELGDTMRRPALIYDYWNHFERHRLALPQGVNYAALGNHWAARAESA